MKADANDRDHDDTVDLVRGISAGSPLAFNSLKSFWFDTTVDSAVSSFLVQASEVASLESVSIRTTDDYVLTRKLQSSWLYLTHLELRGRYTSTWIAVLPAFSSRFSQLTFLSIEYVHTSPEVSHLPPIQLPTVQTLHIACLPPRHTPCLTELALKGHLSNQFFELLGSDAGSTAAPRLRHMTVSLVGFSHHLLPSAMGIFLSERADRGCPLRTFSLEISSGDMNKAFARSIISSDRPHLEVFIDYAPPEPESHRERVVWGLLSMADNGREENLNENIEIAHSLMQVLKKNRILPEYLRSELDHNQNFASVRQ
ncbi:hypothetical protein V5O48_011055, partial [Marasmius crinis-equi]